MRIASTYLYLYNFNLLMKTSLFAFVALFSLYSFSSYAQAPLRVGRNQLNFGVGISGWGVPLYIGFDHGFRKDITLGGEFSFRSFNDNFNNNKYRHSIISLSANGNYHFNSILSIPRNWDFYAGLNLGYYYWNSPTTYRGDGESGIGLGAQIGGRYFFSQNLAANLELGGATVTSGGKFGLTLLF
jgi:outer membrane immunogenic protein